MKLPPRSALWLSGVAALLLLSALFIGETPSASGPEEAVAVFAPAGPSGSADSSDSPDSSGSFGSSGSPGALGSPGPATPEPPGENWFVLPVDPTPPGVSSTAFSLEETAAPAPSPTLEAGFAIELVREGQASLAPAQGPVKRVLIYHTHTYEAFQQTETDPYRETEQWRTQDEKHNMVRVGEELASLLRAMGVQVIHDTTAFEPPDYITSYTRSLDMLRQRKAMGEAYDLYVDVHRDAYVASQPGPNALSLGDGSVARLMMLVGKGEGQTAEGFEEKPQWQDNLAIAQRITASLNSQLSGLGKEVRLKSGRFNQHIAVGCLLVEVGNNRNTLREALAAMPYLADALYEELNRAGEEGP